MTPGSSLPLEALAATLAYPPEEVARKTRAIYEAMLGASPNLRSGNFTAVADADLSHLFGLYDACFYNGAIAAALTRRGHGLSFRVAPRMTQAGGKTYRFRRRRRKTTVVQTDYEIALSSTLLFQSFGDVRREVRINGFVCADRLEAMQRVMEHELLHLVEMVVWGKSSCSGSNFKRLALHTFAHTEVLHDLVTQHERARQRYDLSVGDAVTFVFEGQQYAGRINRITRRATVLVEHQRGARYTDGKRYQKFYVPLGELRKA